VVRDPEFARWLKKARKDAGLTQGQLAQKLGVKPNTVSRWELSRMGPPPPMRHEIARVLGVDYSPLQPVAMQVPEVGVQYPKEYTLPLYLLGATAVGDTDGEHIGGTPVTPHEANVADRAYRLTDDSMAPAFRNGWIIGVRIAETAKPGQLVVALVGGELLFRRYEGAIDGAVLLRPLNASFPVASGREIRIIGIARWFKGESLDGMF
jgi:transcriptional regulator with XRE-family HTH domain